MDLVRVLKQRKDCDESMADRGMCEAREPLLAVLRRRKDLLEVQTNRVQAAILALEQNPGVQEVLDTISAAM